MAALPALPYAWERVLTEYAAGLLDAVDVWNAVDDLAAGRLPDPAALPVHHADLADVDEAVLVREQADTLAHLLRRFLGGELAADDLAAEALDVLGLADADPDAGPAAAGPAASGPAGPNGPGGVPGG